MAYTHITRSPNDLIASAEWNNMGNQVEALSLRFNVKDPAYGAIGNGVADDTAAINACILDAYTAATAFGVGARVEFPGGLYLTQGGHKIWSRLAYVGE